MTQALIATCVGGRRAGYEQPITTRKPPPLRCARTYASKPADTPAGRLYGFTARESEVIESYIRHGSGKVVADELHISLRTFEQTIVRCRGRVGVISSVQLVAAYVTAQLKGNS